MRLICEKVSCRCVFESTDNQVSSDRNGYFIVCPECLTPNELRNIGFAEGPLKLVQPERVSPPHKIVAVANQRDDGRYQSQLVFRRALDVDGPFTEEQVFELGDFETSSEAIDIARNYARNTLGV